MTSVLYLATRFLSRLIESVHDWYVGSFWAIAHVALGTFENLDRSLALRVTLRHIIEPLYQDRSIIGYVIGFIFRVIRIVIALIVYGVIGLVFIVVYILWAAIPIVLIYLIFTNHAIS